MVLRAFGIAAVVMLGAALFGGDGAPRSADAEPLPDIYGVNPSACLMLVPSFVCFNAIEELSSTRPMRDELLGGLDLDGYGGTTREDLARFNLHDGQIHQEDGTLFVVLFVDSDQPLLISTNVGALRAGLNDDRSSFSCSQAPANFFESLEHDEDCDGDAIPGDGIVLAQIMGANAPAGPGILTVTDGPGTTVIAQLPFTIVKEMNAIDLEAVETDVEDRTDPYACQYPRHESPADILTDPTRALLIARVTNEDGIAISGAWVQWAITSSRPRAVLGALETPTLDLGPPYGIAAMNVVCGIDDGTANIKAESIAGSIISNLLLDPNFTPATDSTTVSVYECDFDGDGICTGYEQEGGCLDPFVFDSLGDPDNDGIQSGTEYLIGLDACDPDTDGDGCSESEEYGSNPAFGGDRNPLDFWDFYDVTGDSSIDLNDTLAILARFGAEPPEPNYDPAFDRYVYSADPEYKTQPGEHTAHAGIDLGDAVTNLGSFGHTCAAAP